MPANLTPEYRAAEAAFRKARDPSERLEWLREMLRVMPKHKGTDHLQGDIKRRIKELSEELERPRKGGGRGGPPRRPARRRRPVALIGPRNAGRSTLHARLAAPARRPRPTRPDPHPEPEMMPHEDTHFQLVDLLPSPPSTRSPGLQRAGDRGRLSARGRPRRPRLPGAGRGPFARVLHEGTSTSPDRMGAGASGKSAGDPFRLRLPTCSWRQGGPSRRSTGRAAGAPGRRRARLCGLAVSASSQGWVRSAPGCHLGLARLHQTPGRTHAGSAVRPAQRPDSGGRRPARAQGPRIFAQVRPRMGPVRIRRTACRTRPSAGRRRCGRAPHVTAAAGEPVDVVDEDDRIVATVTRRRGATAPAPCIAATYVNLRNAASEILVHRRTGRQGHLPRRLRHVLGWRLRGRGIVRRLRPARWTRNSEAVGADLQIPLQASLPGGRTARPGAAVYEARWDGTVRPQESEVAWHAWVAPEQLDRMLGALPFCPDSREIFERLRGARAPS